MLFRESTFLGRGGEGVQHGWNARDGGDALLNHEAQGAIEVETRHEYERRTNGQNKVQSDGQTVNVVERQEAEHYFFRSETGGLGWNQCLEDVGDEIGMRQHDSLGEPGGSAGVGKSGESEAWIFSGCGKRGEDGSEQPLEHFCARSSASRGKYASERRQATEVDVGNSGRISDQEGGARAFELVTRLALLITRIHRRNDCASKSRSVVRNRVF